MKITSFFEDRILSVQFHLTQTEQDLLNYVNDNGSVYFLSGSEAVERKDKSDNFYESDCQELTEHKLLIRNIHNSYTEYVLGEFPKPAFLQKKNSIDFSAKTKTWMNLGDLITKLEPLPGGMPIFPTNKKFFDGTWDSYRGDYADLGFGFSDTDEGYNTVGAFRSIVKRAADAGVMQGYKGGEYDIDHNTKVWLANEGVSKDAEMIVDVREFIDAVVLFTEPKA